MANRLAREASPYLQQHAENPVDWYPWGPEAFERARREDRPVLLSVGYSACHWCHVMAHECFEDAAIAALMNEAFVNVKVDREERPDIDQVYQVVVQLLGRSGGWPLTVFLTPDGKPFFGGTYFPPTDRHGLPAFAKVLRATADAYRDKRAEVSAQAAEIAEAIGKATEPEGSPTALSPTMLSRAAARLGARFDAENGGFGSRPKFPNTMALQVLLAHAVLDGNDAAAAKVKRALDAMRSGGVYDQLGGGFHRYSTDERWLVPHFEKMLYDNALLLRLYVDGYRVFQEPSYAETAHDVIAYLVREMQDPSGAFYATEDADSEGEEGRFFVWTPTEIASVCGDADAPLICARFGVTREGNFEEGPASVLSLAATVEELALKHALAPSEVEARLARATAAMLAARQKRPRPFRDEKILTSWNALLVGALAEAGRALDRPDYVAQATRSFEFLWSVLVVGGRALRHVKAGVVKGPGFLDDQAFLADAALDLYEATGDERTLDRARELAATMERDFMESDGTLRFTAKDAEPLISTPRDLYDHSIPSASALALRVLARLGSLMDPAWTAYVEQRLRGLAAAAVENPFGLSLLTLLADRAARGTTDVVLVGGGQDLVRAAFHVYVPHRNVAWCDLQGGGLASQLTRDKHATIPSAFVCHGHTCSLPVTGYGELVKELRWIKSDP